MLEIFDDCAGIRPTLLDYSKDRVPPGGGSECRLIIYWVVASLLFLYSHLSRCLTIRAASPSSAIISSYLFPSFRNTRVIMTLKFTHPLTRPHRPVIQSPRLPQLPCLCSSFSPPYSYPPPPPFIPVPSNHFPSQFLSLKSSLRERGGH